MVSVGTSTSKHQHFVEVLHTNALPHRGHFFCSKGRSLLFISVELYMESGKTGKWESGKTSGKFLDYQRNIGHPKSNIRHPICHHLSNVTLTCFIFPPCARAGFNFDTFIFT
jgi:hypothetical protein